MSGECCTEVTKSALGTVECIIVYKSTLTEQLLSSHVKVWFVALLLWPSTFLCLWLNLFARTFQFGDKKIWLTRVYHKATLGFVLNSNYFSSFGQCYVLDLLLFIPTTKYLLTYSRPLLFHSWLKASSMLLHLSRSWAFLTQLVPATATISSAHLTEGLPLDLQLVLTWWWLNIGQENLGSHAKCLYLHLTHIYVT